MAIDILRKMTYAGLGIVGLTREKAEQLASELAKRGEATKGEIDDLIQKLVARGEEEKKVIENVIAREIERAVGNLNLARKEDLDNLARRLEQLEQKLGT